MNYKTGEENNESAFRAKQVFSWIYKKVYNFNDMNNMQNP